MTRKSPAPKPTPLDADEALRAARAAAAPPLPEATDEEKLSPGTGVDTRDGDGVTIVDEAQVLDAAALDAILDRRRVPRRAPREAPLAGETADSTTARLDDWRAVESIRVTADEDTDDTDRAYFVRLVLAELRRRLPAGAVSPAVAHAAVALDEHALDTIDAAFPDERPHLVLEPSWGIRAEANE